MTKRNMSSSKRSVLITGCSEGGLGSALAVAFHEAGLHVYATARNVQKMKHLEALGIQTLELDVQSASSIAACVSRVPSLDILVNNAGKQMLGPLMDIDIDEAKDAFDVNVWVHLTVTKAFLPLLMRAPNGIVVNNGSIASVMSFPFQAVYGASKAAFAMMTDTLRLELEPFGIKVVELKTGVVRSNLIANVQGTSPQLPQDSIYAPARKEVNSVLRQEQFVDMGQKPEQWSAGVVKDILRPKGPPPVIWRGEAATKAWFSTMLPHGSLDGMLKKLNGLDDVDRLVKAAQKAE